MKDPDSITVRLSPELRRRLQVAARRSGMRESDVVRDGLEFQLAVADGELTACEHAKRAGFIGAAKSKIRDLSTNVRHFDGFGES